MINRTLKYMLPIAIISSFLLCGCSKKLPQIFEKKTDPFAQIEISDTELEDDVYYVKRGTKFIKVAMLNGSVNGKSTEPSANRIVWAEKMEQLVPTFYKGDSLAIKASTLKIKNVTLERFRDAGFSIGVYGATYNTSTGFIDFDAQNQIAKNTPAVEAFADEKSHEIHLETVGGKKVTKDMLDSSGVLNCFEQGKSYEVTYYAGTVYKKSTVKATQHVFESWEIFTDELMKITKRGYISIDIPEDFKSGIYLVEGQGFIKYIDHERGQGSIPQGEEWNVPYYTTNEEKISSYSQAYSVTFDKKTVTPTIQVAFSADSIDSGNKPEGIVISPDGTEYTMEYSDEPVAGSNLSFPDGTNAAYLTLPLQEAMAGKWTIYLTPKTMKILKVQVVSNGNSEMVTEENLTLNISEPSQHMTYFIRWKFADGEEHKSSDKGEDIYGYFIYPNGETYNLEKDDKMSELSYSPAYLPAGTYTMKIFHYSDKTIDESISERITGTQVDQEIVSVSK